MPYTGRPSDGCENCRKSKKSCDKAVPACARCVRLGKACGGYRDALVFRPWTGPRSSRRQSNQSEASSSLVEQPRPSKEAIAQQFFFDQCVTAGHLAFLDGVSVNDFLAKPIVACGLAGIANRSNDVEGRAEARRHYIAAIAATQTALEHPLRVKEDNTLVAVCLLSFFEHIAWEPITAQISWRQHIEGSARVLELRGRSQVRTRSGALLFRELRSGIINNALSQEIPAPDFIVPWTQALDFDPIHTPADELAVLAARVTTFRAAFKDCSQTDAEMAISASQLEADLLAWSGTALSGGNLVSFHNIESVDSQHAWDGTRHEDGTPPSHRHWNLWRVLRILLSRAQEAIWRRSWPSLDATHAPPDPGYYREVRNRMVADICIASAYAFGTDNSAEPITGSVSAGHLLTNALAIAGTCELENLIEPIATPGGSRIVHVDRPFHLDSSSEPSKQLAWIIERLDYIAKKIGVRWAAANGKFLKGEAKLYYDLGRS